jgi:hypothetical protein
MDGKLNINKATKEELLDFTEEILDEILKVLGSKNKK